MKVLKYIVFVILGVIALILIVAFFLPRQFQAGNKITIDKPSSEVYQYVSSLKNQGKFDPWSEKDPNIIRKFEGVDKTVGFTYEWQSDKVGNGKQILTKLDPNRRVEMDIYFDGSDAVNKSFFEIIPLNEQQSEVLWQISGNIPYPFNIMTQFYNMDKDFKHGLENLKSIMEKQE